MATSKKAKPRKESNLPKGFVAARTRLDGFFEREVGNTVQGVLRGTFKVQGKFGLKNVYRIEVTEGETQVGEGEMIGPGGVVGLDESGYTSALAELENGTNVYVRYEGVMTPGVAPSKANPHIFTVGKAE